MRTRPNEPGSRPDARRRLSPSRHVAVGERAEEGHDVVDLGVGQRRRLARLAAEGRVGVDVRPVLRRQVVELARRCRRRSLRVPALGVGVALGVERDRLAQRVEHAVVEEGLAGGDVAQRRRAEQAAILLAVAEVGAQRAAQAEVEIARIGVGRDVGIARHAERDQAVVGELRRRAVVAALADVAGGAVALGRVLEQRRARALLRRQRRLAGEVGVVLAASRDRRSRQSCSKTSSALRMPSKRSGLVGQDRVAEDRAQGARRSRPPSARPTTSSGCRWPSRRARAAGCAPGRRRGRRGRPRSGRRSGRCRRSRRPRPRNRRNAR